MKLFVHGVEWSWLYDASDGQGDGFVTGPTPSCRFLIPVCCSDNMRSIHRSWKSSRMLHPSAATITGLDMTKVKVYLLRARKALQVQLGDLTLVA